MGARTVAFDHIALAAHRLSDAVPVLVSRLGGVPDGGAPSTAFTWASWRFSNGGRLEVIEPRGGDGFLHRFLAARGPGIHHVTFKVPDLARACERAEAHGYRIVSRDDRDPLWKEAFLHPSQALGIVVQFAEEHGTRPASGPTAPGTPAPVAIVGLRMRVRSADRAAVQWQAVLDGEPGVEDGSLVYRWPGSPMRLVVDVDSSEDEGPVCIEFASDRVVDLPCPVPGLGACFREVGGASS